MSKEIACNFQVTITRRSADGTKVLVNYQPRPTSFVADQSVQGGPTPGVISALATGVDVSLAAITTPGIARFMNQDPTNYVEYGPRDLVSGEFFPLGEILPGEFFILRLSRELGVDHPGTGTATAGSVALHFRGVGGAVPVLVEVFNR